MGIPGHQLRIARAAMELFETAFAQEPDTEHRRVLIAGAAEPRGIRHLALNMLALDSEAGEAFEEAAPQRSSTFNS